jgi:peptidoglycan/xylan/chitin deacetylase (PgdA/CDA1 family)
MRKKRTWLPPAYCLLATVGVGAAILIAAGALASGQVPGQVPGQGPGPIPPTPSIHIPHVGGSRQERPPQETSTEGQVYVLLWFDTEDYILPQSDDAAKRIAAFLTQQGVPATFKLVGEKARTLQRRNRQDVIAALAQHEIGYHSNTHSQHPTVAEYESNLDWDSGVQEFSRRERPGFDDVTHIFRKTPAAYGQPGASWAPQAFPALEKWGVRVYLDEGKHVGLRGRPFWYGGLLNIFNTRDGEQLRPDANWSNLDTAKVRFQDTYTTMSSRKEGGVISIHFHPCEFVQKEFWDAVNFSDGANPPPNEWKLPPMKTPEETEKAFQYLEELVRFMKSFPRVQFLTASGAAERFRDRAHNHVFTLAEIGALAGQVDSEVSFQAGNGFNLTASEVFYLINKSLAGIVRRQGTEPILMDRTPDGPTARPEPLTAKLVVPWNQVARTVVDVQDDLDKTGRIPSAVWLGSQFVPPESYLVGIAQATQAYMQKTQLPDSLSFGPARLAAADYVADDSPGLWNWVIFPNGFHAPKLMLLAKLQAWTLKPVRN